MRKTLLMAAVLTGMTGAATLPAYSVTVQGFYEEEKSRTCNLSRCTLTFSTVPAGKLLTVKHASCHITAGGPSLSSLHLFANKRTTYLIPVLLLVSGSSRIFVSSNEVTKIVEGGQAPLLTVVFVSSTPATITCTLTGQFAP